jgi:hypothetical protein
MALVRRSIFTGFVRWRSEAGFLAPLDVGVGAVAAESDRRTVFLRVQTLDEVEPGAVR